MYTGIDIKIVERAMNRAVCLGKNIRKYRKRKNMTQAELAEKILVSPQNVSKWENGNSLPDVPSLCMLSDVLDISIGRLVGRVFEDNCGKLMIGIDGGGTKSEFCNFKNFKITIWRKISKKAGRMRLYS